MLRSASEHARSQRRLIAATQYAVRREWARMGDNLDASWAGIAPRVVQLVTAAQLGAARTSIDYVPRALEEQGRSIRAQSTVRPAAFAGVASTVDGLAYGDLGAMLYGAVVRARTAPAESLTQRLDVGGRWLEQAAHTQVADAGRMATSTAIAARPKTGWIRMVSPPCCQRCAVLAGKHFKWNSGFDRHPGCDCEHLPYAESDPYDPGIYIGPEDVKDLTKAQRQAIADGADMNQVINAHRHGERSGDLMWTREGTTRRGWASHTRREIARQKGETVKETATQVGRRGAVKNSVERRFKRPTPEAIYRFTDSREEAIRLLKENGYFV